MRLVRLATSLVLPLAGLAPAVRPASAQAIAGLVVDSRSRLPARLLAVRVLGDSGRPVFETRTDTAGIFTAVVPAAGTYRVRFVVDSTTTFDSDTIRVAGDAYVERQFIVSFPRIFLDLEVEKQAAARPENGTPQYPAEMLQREIQGEVVAQFVVDTTGLAMLETFRALRSPDPAFTLAVKFWLLRARFYPAEIAGVRVRQMVQLPFTFALSGRAPRTKPLDADWPPPMIPSPPRMPRP